MEARTILVVEDNEMNMKLVRSLIQLSEYRMLEAVDAERGIQMARDHHPDLILMDIQLPGMDGLSATRIIKKESSLEEIPIMALSSYAMAGDEEKAREAGCDAYMTKPVNTRDFLKVIDGLFTQFQDTTQPLKAIKSNFMAKVLIVDDEPMNVKLLTAKLDGGNYEILQAYRGEKALEMAKKLSPDVILLDIMMPEMDGYEVTKKLKADPETAHIPVILVTALDGSEDKIQGLETGAEEFLSKPVNTIELLARVESVLRLKQYREQLAMRTKSEGEGVVSENGKSLIESKKGHFNVLLVEDDDNDRRLIGAYLHEQPYNIIHAGCGEEALTFAANENIDLILMDILLPGMDGFETCKRLKAMDNTRDIQIVLITSLSELEDKIRGLELGADDFMFKPVNSRELLARIKVLLKKKSYLDRLYQHYDTALNSAITDGLTGLYNHQYFKRFLDLEIKRCKRQSYQTALMMLDIDDFKNYNDILGHLAGDTILRELTQLIRKNIREIDLAARYGGDEFVVVLPYSDQKGALGVADRLLKEIRAHKFMPDATSPPQPVTVSVGIALCPTDAETVENLIQKADEMLYRAKNQGKNRVCVYERILAN